MVKVTNLDNGKSVVVRVTDRGPFVGDRLIDVSRAAASALDMMKTGVARVSLEVVGRPDAAAGAVYRLQVGSFRQPENVRRMKSRLADKGLAVFSETAADGCTRVFVDNVAAADLERTRDVLRGLGIRDHVVIKVN